MSVALIPVYKRGQVVAHAVVDDDLPMLADLLRYKWQLSKKGYAHRAPSRWSRTPEGFSVRTSLSIRLHRVIMGCSSPLESVDHIDGDPLNNRRSNLEVVSVSVNSLRQCWRNGGVGMPKARPAWFGEALKVDNSEPEPPF